MPENDAPSITALRHRLGAIGFGGDYNPEQWPEEVWAQDLRLMKETGVNLVTVGVFSWAHVQPRAGVFDFGWFDRVMDLLSGAGIAADLATMTASPPPWLARNHPQILPVRDDGVVLSPGGRQHFNPSSPIYREHAAELVEAVATRYRDHPALALWHIGNEYGCHIGASYDDISAVAFRDWLRRRYAGDVDTLNDAWSTAFWSQRYDDFDEVLPPRIAPTYPNPGQQLDFARFSDDALRACYQLERDILARITPEVPATTNFLALHKPVDQQAWAGHVDLVSVDSYPDPFDPHAHHRAGLAYDVVRSVRGGQPWFLTEQAPAAVNWRSVNAVKRPGQMRLWSWQAIAHGADAVLFFQWRQSRGGAEKFHSGMIPHAGTDTRVFREISSLGQELADLPELAGTRISNRVALLLDWQSWWALELDSHPSNQLDQIELLSHYYRPLFDAGVGTDVIHPDADLSSYRVIVVPSLYLLRPESADRLDAWVRAGGHLVVSFFSGVVDENDRVHLGGYLGPLATTLGLDVEEYTPQAPDQSTTVTLNLDGRGEEVLSTVWAERLRLKGAQPVATFGSGDLVGSPAVTRYQHDQGTAWYLGTQLDPAGTRTLIEAALRGAEVEATVPGLPDGVQAALRESADGTERFLILLNHADESRSVAVPAGASLALGPDRGSVPTEIVLARFDVAVLKL